VPFFVASAVFCGIAMLAQRSGGALLETLSLSTRCLNAVLVYGLYVQRAIWPFGLAPFYPHPDQEISLTAAGVSLAFLIIVTIFAWAGARRFPFVAIGWLWYLGTLVPMIGLVQIGQQQMADRYTYFPLLGLYIAVGWLIATLAPASTRRRYVLPAVASLVIALYGAIGFVQAGHWRDTFTLFNHALKVTPDNSVAHAALGAALVRQDRLDEAAAEYRAALALHDDFGEVHNDLGLILLQQQRYPEAKRHFERMIELNPRYANAYGNLGILHGQLGDYGRSVAFSERAIEIDPLQVSFYRNLASAFSAQGRVDEAVDRLHRALELAPGDAATQTQLEELLAMKSNRRQSRQP
jgi:tetratricopeptide (TPR) repeat protein